MITYPLSLGLHSTTDIVQAVNDLNARLFALERKSAPDGDGAKRAIECRPCPHCGEGVAWQTSGGLGAHPIQYHDCKQPARAGDDAVVDAMDNAYQPACSVSTHEEKAHKDGLRAVLVAIRAGEIPTICNMTTNEMTMWTETGALKAKLAAAEREIESLKADAAHNVDVLQEYLDAAKTKDAENADLKVKLAADEAHIVALTGVGGRQYISLLEQERNKLRADLAEAKAERDHWRSNHDNQVAIKRTVLDRPDLAERAKLVEKLTTELAEAKATLHAAELSVHTWHDAEAKAQAELAEAKALLTDVAKNGDRLTFNSWYQTNFYRFGPIIADGGDKP